MLRQFKIIFIFLSLVSCSSLTNVKELEHTVILKAARVFDGQSLKTNLAIVIKKGVIENVGKFESLSATNAKIIDLGDATILPGFIELHAHLSYHKIPAETVLRHGITTIRDLAGPLHQPYGGKGNLRILTAGPIITAPNGYPIPVFGKNDNVISVATEAEARKTVNELVDGGAVVIKIALEPGGELGAPWSTGHGHSHGHGHKSHDKQQWPLLPENIVTAIVDEAHKQNRKVTAHIGEVKGAEISINSGVDEWAHMPCAVIPENLLRKAVEQQIKIITTIDTLSKCSGIRQNIEVLASLNADLLYGSEIAHTDVPWGINAQELFYIKNLSKISVIETLKKATSEAGQYLSIPLLGRITEGAPADIIAVKGNPIDNMKSLEYPGFVMSGGIIIENNLSTRNY